MSTNIDIGIDASIKEKLGLPNAVARTARKVFETAESIGDQPRCGLLTQRMQVHENTPWMPRSLFE